MGGWIYGASVRRRRSPLRWPMRTVTWYLVGFGSVVAAPQVSQGQGSIVVIGRVVAPDQPPHGDPQLTLVSHTPRFRLEVSVGKDGAFAATLPHRTGTITVIVTSAGFATLSRTFEVPQRDTVQLPELVLVRRAQELPRVHAVADRPRPERQEGPPAPGPGDRAASLAPGALPTGDLSGDPAFAIAALPGVQVTPGAAGGPPEISIAGVSPLLNRTTLNGSLAAATPPRDGAILQVLLSSYDPARASGGLVANWEMLSGNNLPTRRIRGSVSVPAREVGTASTAWGAAPVLPIVSANVAGPGRGFAKFVNASAQVSAHRAHIPSILTASPAALTALGLAPDTISRLASALPDIGLPAARGALERRSVHASGFARIDLTGNAVASVISNLDGTVSAAGPGRGGDVRYLLLGASLSDAASPGALPALPHHGATARAHSFLAQGVWSRFTRGGALTETRVGLSHASSRTASRSGIPAAMVTFPQPSGEVAGLVHLGGTGAPTVDRADWLVHVMNETRVQSADRRHEYKLALEASAERLVASREGGAGAFAFGSPADFMANQPASFTRTLHEGSEGVAAVRLGLGVGDLFRPTRAFHVQYGARVEAEIVARAGDAPPASESLPGIDAQLPRWVALSPMAGFSWSIGRDARGLPGYPKLRGGIRDYRGALPLGAYIRSANRSGAITLRCIGDDVPIPDWIVYRSDQQAIPDSCAGSHGSSAVGSRARDVESYAASFRPGHSWRGELAFEHALPARIFATVHGSFTRNAAQPLPVDVNFDGFVRAAASAEGGRLRYFAKDEVAAESGLVEATGARRDRSLGHHLEHRAGKRGSAASLGLTIAHRPAFAFYSSGIHVPFSVDYTFADIRIESNGYAGTTAGDPRRIERARGSYSRHTVLVSGAVRIPDVVTASLGIQLRSGRPFTPVVGSDVNGDGLANDRAFVPSGGGDDVGVEGWRELLAAASPRIRRCLESHAGRIAVVNACEGAWTATANAALTIDPSLLRLQNRGSVRVLFTNLGAGLDALLHGSGGRRGWGQPAWPDPVLLHVRGFDPATGRFRYVANSGFGSSAAYRAAFPAPFRIAFEISIDVGRSHERRMMEERLARDDSEPHLDVDEITRRLRWRGPELFARVLALGDSLRLTPNQADSLRAWSRRHSAYRDSVYRELAAFLEARRGDFSGREVGQRWRGAIEAVRWHEWSFRERLRRLLVPHQFDAVFSESSPAVPRLLLLDRDEAKRYLSRWFLGPG